jgi:APA family basic amino acid/polyamine antiporter
MARDGLLPQSFAKVHPRFRTPYVTTILTGVAVAVCSMFTSIDEMVDLTNIGTLFAFTLVCLGILILRKRDPLRPRAFRTPFVPLLPILGVLSCIYLMLGLPWVTWLRFALWLIVGMMVYFSYGFKRSSLAPHSGGTPGGKAA